MAKPSYFDPHIWIKQNTLQFEPRVYQFKLAYSLQITEELFADDRHFYLCQSVSLLHKSLQVAIRT